MSRCHYHDVESCQDPLCADRELVNPETSCPETLRDNIQRLATRVGVLEALARDHFRLSAARRGTQRGMSLKERHAMQERMLGAGFTHSDVARVFGCTSEAIAQQHGRSGNQYQPKREADFARIVELLAEGRSIVEVCALMNCTNSIVRNAMARHQKKYSDFAKARYDRKLQAIEVELRAFVKEHNLTTLTSALLSRYSTTLWARTGHYLPISEWRKRLGMPEKVQRLSPTWLPNTKAAPDYRAQRDDALAGLARPFSVITLAQHKLLSYTQAYDRVVNWRTLGLVQAVARNGRVKLYDVCEPPAPEPAQNPLA